MCTRDRENELNCEDCEFIQGNILSIGSNGTVEGVDVVNNVDLPINLKTSDARGRSSIHISLLFLLGPMLKVRDRGVVSMDIVQGVGTLDLP